MKIAKYWALDEITETDPRGEKVTRQVYGGSDVSEAEAKSAARRRAESIAQRIRMGEIGGRFHERWYEYARQSKPEPIVEEFHDDGGRRVGAITANRYGAYVLNTAELAFVDVDLRPRANSLLGSLLGRKKPDPEREALDKLEAWIGGSSGGGRAARVYRTRSGLRYLVPSPLMRPDSDQTRAIMDQLGADKLYVTLCKHQQSFRARLTPKPWRLPPAVPSPDYRAGGAPSEAWRSSHAVCELLGEFGRAEESASTTELVAVHDAWTNVGSGLPLA